MTRLSRSCSSCWTSFTGSARRWTRFTRRWRGCPRRCAGSWSSTWPGCRAADSGRDLASALLKALPAASLEPALQHRQAVGAPEGFILHKNEGRAEDAACQGRLDLLPGPVLDPFIFERRLQGGLRNSQPLLDRDDAFGGHNVTSLGESAPIERQDEVSRRSRVAILAPVDSAAGSDRGEREGGWKCQRQRMLPGAARHVTARIVALHRLLNQGLTPDRLENRTEQKGPPGDPPPLARRQGLDLLRCQIAIGTGEIEIELEDCACHGLSSRRRRGR